VEKVKEENATMRQGGLSILMAGATALLLSCSEATTGSSTQNQSKQDEGRKDTRAVKALDAVGYDGNQIRKNVDAALNKNDQHNKDIDQAVQNADGK
jgi:Holliday junction resolvasome RuvABC DNA-binding subunit